MSAWLILANRPAILHPAEYFHPPGWGNGYDMATYDFLFGAGLSKGFGSEVCPLA